MSVVKIIELIAKSPDGFDAAVREGVAQASKSVRNINSVYVQDMQAKVVDAKVTEFKVCLKVSFLVED